MATEHTKTQNRSPTSSWPTTASFPIGLVLRYAQTYLAHWESNQESLILYQGGSSTTIRLYVRQERNRSCLTAKLVKFS